MRLKAETDQLMINVTRGACLITYPACTWLILLAMYFAEVIMCVRTWALWRRNLHVGLVLLTTMIACLVAQCVLMAKLDASIVIEPTPYHGFRGCNLSKLGNILGYNFVVWLVVDAIVLALVVASASKAFRNGDTSKLMKVVHRDGILFYVYLLVFSVGNVIVINVLPSELWAMLGSLEGVLYSVFSSRIILNIREAAHHGASSHDNEIELHTHQELSTFIARHPVEDDHNAWVHGNQLSANETNLFTA